MAKIPGVPDMGPRTSGGISGAGGRNVNPVNRPLSRNAQKAIDALRAQKGWKELTPEESAKIKATAQKNAIERIKKGMG